MIALATSSHISDSSIRCSPLTQGVCLQAVGACCHTRYLFSLTFLFLHATQYVEQFDVQQPELTIRETVEFCAQLRLDKNDPKIGSDEGKKKYAAYVLGLMELTNIQNLQVGSFAVGGLTFEQRKRLSIACELAGSPSVIFLDGKCIIFP